MMIYGGGPAIYRNKIFMNYEVKKDPVAEKLKRKYLQNPVRTISKKELPKLKEGIVGFKNNNFDCYLIACL